MPIPHVEYLLEVYAEYLDKRMLESGRLSKGKWLIYFKWEIHF